MLLRDLWRKCSTRPRRAQSGRQSRTASNPRVTIDTTSAMSTGFRVPCTRRTLVRKRELHRQTDFKLQDTHRAAATDGTVPGPEQPCRARTARPPSVSTEERAALPLPRPQASTRPAGVAGDPLRPAHRDRLDAPTARALFRQAAVGDHSNPSIRLPLDGERGGDPATGSASENRDADTRALADQQRAMETERTRAARELHAAKRELAGMGAIGRARHGRRLRDHIAQRRQTLTRLDSELDRLAHQLHTSRQHALQLARPERPHRSRGLAHTQNRERGLQLGLDR
jgi:hypothetical protein